MSRQDTRLAPPVDQPLKVALIAGEVVFIGPGCWPEKTSATTITTTTDAFAGDHG